MLKHTYCWSNGYPLGGHKNGTRKRGEEGGALSVKRRVSIQATKKLLVSLLFFNLLTAFTVPSFSKEVHSEESSEGKKIIKSNLPSLRVPFVANQGQAHERVRFYARTFGGTVSVMKDGEIVYSMDAQGGQDGSPKTSRVVGFKEALAGARIKEILGRDVSSAKVNYFMGNDKNKWKIDIQTYDTVTLGETYDGIELRLRAHGNNVEKFFYINPGAKVEDIKVALKEATDIRIEQGRLEFKAGQKTLSFSKPIAYQEIDGKKMEVEVGYRISEERNAERRNVTGEEANVEEDSELRNVHPEIVYGFKVTNYDRTRPLVIDPVLSYSTYLGGSGDDFGRGIAVDGSGNVYITGETLSTNFPTQTPIQWATASLDVFVTKCLPSHSST
jgi:hypothetical protein